MKVQPRKRDWRYLAANIHNKSSSSYVEVYYLQMYNVCIIYKIYIYITVIPIILLVIYLYNAFIMKISKRGKSHYIFKIE